MSNSNIEDTDRSSNVVGFPSQASIEATANDAPANIITDDKIPMTQMENISISPTINTSNTPIYTNSKISSPGREDIPRGRGKPFGGRRNDYNSGHPTPQYGYKTNYASMRGGVPDNQNPNMNRGPTYPPQKNRSRSGDMNAYGQKNIPYSPASPSHSINQSGSVTPNSSIHTSPIGSFPSPPMLPEVVQFAYGQPFMPAMAGGIAGMGRPMDPHYMQNPQMMDPRFQPQIMVSSTGQPMLPPGVQYINVAGMQQGNPASPGKMQFVPASMMGMMPNQLPPGQPYYTNMPGQDMRGMMGIPQFQGMPYGAGGMQMQPNIMYIPQPNPQQQNPQMKPGSYNVSSQGYDPNHNHSHNQAPPQQPGAATDSMNQPPPDPKPKKTFIIKDKDGKVFEDVKAYKHDTKAHLPNPSSPAQDVKENSITAQEVKIDVFMPHVETEAEREAAKLKAEADAKLASLSAIPVFIPPRVPTPPPAPVPPVVAPIIMSETPAPTTAEQRPVVDAKVDIHVPATSSSTSAMKQSVIPEKSKKSAFKDKLAAADAHANRGDNLLDAYTSIPPPTISDDMPSSSQPEPSISDPVSVPVAEADDDWETAVDKIDSGQKTINLIHENQVTPAKTTRSLRPQTGSVQKLNSGPTNRPAVTRLIYSRDVVLKLRGTIFPDNIVPERPSQFSMYAHLPEIVSSSTGATSSSSSSSNKPSKASMSRQSSSDGSHRNDVSSHDMSDNAGSWKREREPSQAAASESGGRGGGGGNRARNPRVPVPPPPKKIISDPMEALTLQIRSILNKITPQTFDKLAGQIKDIKITSRELCDQLVSMIFEKAIFEQNFSNLYAELCSDLEKQLAIMPFVHVIYYRDSNQYAWVIDVDMENYTLAGPYHTPKDCINASMNDILPPTHIVPYRLAIHELIVHNNILIKIYKNLSNSSEEQYFCGFVPMTDIEPSSMSDKRFSSLEEATKSAKKKYSIRGRLLKFCEEEFFQSSDKSEKYEAVEIAKLSYEKNKSSMTADEAAIQKQHIEELQDKLKRRMLGTIRFIGELFKQGLANTQVVIACMFKLLCDSTHENGSPKDFKPYPPDIDLEVLCKLVRTVGSEFTNQTQAKATERYRNFDACLAQMQALSTDKKRSARIRFSLEEVINLRHNNWIERRQEEGPLTIDEIHRRIDEENKRAGMPSNFAGTNKSSSARQSSASDAREQQSNSRGNTTSSSGRGNMNAGRDTQIRIQGRKPEATSSTFKSSSANSNDDMSSKSPPHQLSSDQHHTSSSMNENERLKVSFDDYLLSPNDSDIMDVISDRSPSLVAHLINMMLVKCSSDTKASTHSLIRALIMRPAMQPVLMRSKHEICEEIAKCEQLQLLPDTTLDLKQAPEMFGAFLAPLIAVGVLDMNWIVNFTQSAIKDNLDIYDEQTVNDMFKRLVDAAANAKEA